MEWEEEEEADEEVNGVRFHKEDIGERYRKNYTEKEMAGGKGGTGA